MAPLPLVLPLPIAVLGAGGAALILAGVTAALHRSLTRSCVVCGCTLLHACPGGCWWASLNPPICSRCT